MKVVVFLAGGYFYLKENNGALVDICWCGAGKRSPSHWVLECDLFDQLRMETCAKEKMNVTDALEKVKSILKNSNDRSFCDFIAKVYEDLVIRSYPSKVRSQLQQVEQSSEF